MWCNVAVSSVKVASIIGVLPALDEVIKVCGKSGIFHPDDALSFYSKNNNFVPLSEGNPYSEPLRKLKDMVKRAGMKLQLVDIADFEVSLKEINDYVNYINYKMGLLLEKKQDILNRITKHQKAQENIGHFIGLDLNLAEIFACKYIKVRFGKLPKESFEKLNASGEDPYMLFFPCTVDEKACWGVYFAPLENIAEVDRKFAGLYFERMWLNQISGTPETELEIIKGLISDTNAELENINRKIESFWKTQKDQCLRFYTKLEEMNTYFTIKNYVSKYNESFILVGWIPQEEEENFAHQLSDVYGIEFSIERADNEEKHSPPVKLKNNRFSRPFESFVEMYGLPSYNEIDPTVIVSVLYTLLFGIMFGDFGQGIVLSAVGAVMWRLKKMMLGRILIRCGFAASVFGLIYGAVFGLEHVLDPMYKVLFNLDEKPVDVLEPKTVMTIIILAVILGAGIIILSMILNIYSSLRRRNYENALFGQNGVAGLIFYGSLVASGGTMAQGVNVVSLPYVLGLMVLPVVLIFFKEPLGKLLSRAPDWKPKKWGEYMVQNGFELFEIMLSYVTNTMSFLRVGAYVLVHAGMMMVVFTIAQIMPGGVVGYTLMAVFGNVFVIALEGLLVGIQVLRLNFYELFSRFFEGQGRPFAPIRVSEENL